MCCQCLPVSDSIVPIWLHRLHYGQSLCSATADGHEASVISNTGTSWTTCNQCVQYVCIRSESVDTSNTPPTQVIHYFICLAGINQVSAHTHHFTDCVSDSMTHMANQINYYSTRVASTSEVSRTPCDEVLARNNHPNRDGITKLIKQ